jgi:hypothetical protein
MENNQNNNKGTFPGDTTQTTGSIQTGPPIQNQPIKPISTNIDHHDSAPASAVETIQNDDGITTFIRLETVNSENVVSGIIEVDLISFREKGQESRFLSINTTGAGEDGNSSTTSININNEQDFDRFKKFISELNWND